MMKKIMVACLISLDVTAYGGVVQALELACLLKNGMHEKEDKVRQAAKKKYLDLRDSENVRRLRRKIFLTKSIHDISLTPEEQGLFRQFFYAFMGMDYIDRFTDEIGSKEIVYAKNIGLHTK